MRIGRRVATAGATGVLVLAVSGCGAGQLAQTSEQVTATGGIEGSVGSILVRDAQFTYQRPVPGDTVYEVGDDAALQVTIVNDSTALVDDGLAADRLVMVSSPIATGSRIEGDARIPDGQVLTAGYDQPLSSIVVPGAKAVAAVVSGPDPAITGCSRSGDRGCGTRSRTRRGPGSRSGDHDVPGRSTAVPPRSAGPRGPA